MGQSGKKSKLSEHWCAEPWSSAHLKLPALCLRFKKFETHLFKISLLQN